VLSELAQRMPEGTLGQVLEAARAIQDEGERARVLSELAQRMPEGTLGQVLEAARAIQVEGARASVLSELASPLLKILYGDRYCYLEYSLSILSHRTRPDLLSDMTALMPVLIEIGTEDTPHEIHQAVRDVTKWWP
jgi:uncharacterized protein (DUF3820 family)